MDIDIERLSNDLDYWEKVAPDDECTHYCTECEGFEYLTKGMDCDIEKPKRKREKKQ